MIEMQDGKTSSNIETNREFYCVLMGGVEDGGGSDVMVLRWQVGRQEPSCKWYGNTQALTGELWLGDDSEGICVAK
jgi:hypothetical protein